MATGTMLNNSESASTRERKSTNQGYTAGTGVKRERRPSDPRNRDPGLLLRPNLLESILAFPLVSLLYRSTVTLCSRLSPSGALRIVRVPVWLMLSPFRRLRMEAIGLFFRSQRLSRTECRTIDDAFIDYQRRLLVENISLAGPCGADFLKGVTVGGAEHVAQTLAGGRGAAVVCTHVGNWMLIMAVLASLGHRVAGLGYRIPIRAMEGHMRKIWNRFGIRIRYVGDGSTDFARMELRKNALLVVAFDVSVRPASSAWFPFGDIAMKADPEIAEFIYSLGVPVVRAQYRVGPGLTSSIFFRPQQQSGIASAGDLRNSWMRELHDEVKAAPALWSPWSIVQLADSVALPESGGGRK